MVFKILIPVLLSILISSCGTQEHSSVENKEPEQLVIFSAASLTDVLSELTNAFSTNTHCKIQVNTGSSGTLARQIAEGATPHIYLSANKKWARYIDSIGYVVDSMHKNIAQNSLVLIAPIESPIAQQAIDSSLSIATLLGDKRLSMGDPQHVPAGKYAQQAINYYGWHTALDKKILPAKDVRSALMMVEMGEAPLGIVYKTDAEKSSKVKIIGVFPDVSHATITYVASVCTASELSLKFYAFLDSEMATTIWAKYGFDQ